MASQFPSVSYPGQQQQQPPAQNGTPFDIHADKYPKVPSAVELEQSGLKLVVLPPGQNLILTGYPIAEFAGSYKPPVQAQNAPQPAGGYAAPPAPRAPAPGPYPTPTGPPAPPAGYPAPSAPAAPYPPQQPTYPNGSNGGYPMPGGQPQYGPGPGAGPAAPPLGYPQVGAPLAPPAPPASPYPIPGGAAPGGPAYFPQQSPPPPLNYNTDPSQYAYSQQTLLQQEAHFVESGLDDRESELYNLQLVFLIDVSGSMEEADKDPEGKGRDGMFGQGRWTRYDNMVKIMTQMTADLAKFDKDGRLPTYFFSDTVRRMDLSDPASVIQQIRAVRPGGGTLLHKALYEASGELNDVDNFLFIVFTDGVPDDTAAVESVIQNEIHRRDPRGDRIHVLFVRFGDDPGAVHFLQDQDDHRVYGRNVDVKSDNACYLLGPKLLVLNAVHEKIEKDPKWAGRLAQCR